MTHFCGTELELLQQMYKKKDHFDLVSLASSKILTSLVESECRRMFLFKLSTHVLWISISMEPS